MPRLLETLTSYFGVNNVRQAGNFDGIFVCEKKSLSDITYQIVYIDSTDNWIKDDYIKHLESVVEDNYYRTNGFLQWNYYYYIITSSEKLHANKQRKRSLYPSKFHYEQYLMNNIWHHHKRQ